MPNPKINRHEWLKAVTQDDSLTDRAKVMAVALWTFSNDDTGQLNPTVPTLADYVKRNIATVKRAVADLVLAGWLSKTEGRGRGNRTSYELLSRGKVVAFRVDNHPSNSAPKKGATVRFKGKEKGAAVLTKGCSSAPFYNKEEQPYEQRDDVRQRYRLHYFTGNNYPGLTLVASSNRDALYAWGRWLKEQGFPALDHYPIEILGKKNGSSFFSLPWKTPPTEADLINEAFEFFGSMQGQEDAHAVNS